MPVSKRSGVSGSKGLIARSLLEQQEAYERESAVSASLLEYQASMTESLLLLPSTMYAVGDRLAGSVSASVASALQGVLSLIDPGLDGSHFNGLSYVPFDGYRAELHKGERVLTASENRAFSMPVVHQSSNAEVVAELRALRQEHGKVLNELAEIKRSNAQLAEQFDTATAGGNAMAVEAI